MSDSSTPAPRRRLSDILNNGGVDSLREQWSKIEAAGDPAPLPSGIYEAHVHAVELHKAKTGTPGVKITFRVCDGEHTGRMVFHDCWLTAAALPMAKRDLAKLGVTSLEQLERPLPQGVRCKVRLVLRRDDDGTEHNRVRSFEVIGIDEPEPNPFAPTDTAAPSENVSRSDSEAGAATTQANADAVAFFAFGANNAGGAKT